MSPKPETVARRVAEMDESISRLYELVLFLQRRVEALEDPLGARAPTRG